MDIIDAIQSRKSIRGFKSKPVPKKVLTELLDVSRRAPSGFNEQSWEFIILTGKVLEQVKQGNKEQFDQGTRPYNYLCPPILTGKYRERQIASVQSLHQALGIAGEDEKNRQEWGRRNVAFHDAPAAILVCADEEAREYRSLFEAGIVSQTIVLAAMHFGLGTCLIMAPVYYPDVLRKLAKIPESKRIYIAIAIGYPDWDFPANKLYQSRDSLSEFVTWRSQA